MVDTLLIDQETIYDSRRGNDRLLLGLKGSLNEYELDILRLRAVEARHEKARRGELVVIRSAGYITTDEGIVKTGGRHQTHRSVPMDRVHPTTRSAALSEVARSRFRCSRIR